MCPEHPDDDPPGGAAPGPGEAGAAPTGRARRHRDDETPVSPVPASGAGAARGPELDELLGAAHAHLQDLASVLAGLEELTAGAAPSAPRHAGDVGSAAAPAPSRGPELERLTAWFDRIRAQRRYHDLSYLVDQLRGWVITDVRQWVRDSSLREAEMVELRERLRSKDEIIRQLWQWHRDRGYSIALNTTASRAKRRFRRWSNENRAWIDKIGRGPEPGRASSSPLEHDLDTVMQMLAEMDAAMRELWSGEAEPSRLTPPPDSKHRRAGEATQPSSRPKGRCSSSGSAPGSTDAAAGDSASARAARSSIAIYTAVTGKPDVPDITATAAADCDFVCFTDSEVACSRRWRLREFDYFNADPQRTLRYVKVHPHLYLGEYEWSIWVDSERLERIDLAPLVQQLQAGDENVCIATFRHPRRDCVYAEADALLADGDLDRPDSVERQMERYRNQGYPAHAGLYDTAVIVRRHNEPEVIELMTAWWREIDNGSKLDQLSLGFAARERSVAIRCLERVGASDRPGLERYSLGRGASRT